MQPKSQELEDALKQLHVFVGSWEGTGEFLEGAGPGAGSHLKTKEEYQWLPGGYFLVTEGSLDFGVGKIQAHRVIGYDEESATYTMHAFDSIGFARQYSGKVDGNVWHFVGELERVTYTFSDGGKQLQNFWENSQDGKHWLPLCKTEEAKLG